MLFEVQGLVSQIDPEVSGEGKAGTWTKQEFTLETQEQYPKKMHFSAWGEKLFFLKDLNQGESIKVVFTIESRDFNQRWYTDLRLFKLEKTGVANQPGPQTNPPGIPLAGSTYTEPSIPQPQDDLPF